MPEWYILLDVAPDLNTDIFALAGTLVEVRCHSCKTMNTVRG